MASNVEVSMEEIKKFFLEASAKTYAASMPKATIVGLPGSETLRYQRGNLIYVDCYYPGSKGRSFGFIIISSDRVPPVPLWGMQYNSKWIADTRIIPFLKNALRENYEAGVFYGGRGRDFFAGDLLVYRNFVAKNDFANCEGYEEIYERQTSKWLFRRDYKGLLL